MRRVKLVLAFLGMAACGGPHYFECTENASCNSAGGGTCVASPSGASWCAYPDPECPSGDRYAEDAGDGLAGTCVPGNRYTLTVSIGGMGVVTSAPEGLTCTSSSCSAQFREGTIVDLTATASMDSFLGWSDTCIGQGTCTVTMDADRAVGALFGTPGQALWAKQFGSSADQLEEFGDGIALDGNGDLIVVGKFENTITPKAGMDLISAGSSDIFVMKMSSATGDVIWAKRFGGIDADGASDVVVDASNNIYVTGQFQGTVNFGGGAKTAGLTDVFALKLDSDGNYGWARTLGGADTEYAYAIALRGPKVVVVGEFYSATMVDSMPITGGGAVDIFVHSMLTATGATDWFKYFGGTSNDIPFSVDIDGGGSVLVTGQFIGTVNFGNGPVTASGTDAFLLKLAGSNGAHQVSLPIGSSGFDTGLAIAVDESNNVLLSGDFNGTVDLGCPNTITASQTNRSDMFLAKFSQAGSCQWVKSFGGTGGTGNYGPHGNDIVTNSNGDVAVVGHFCGTVNFGGSTLSAPGMCAQTDVFAARFSAGGMHLNSARAGGTGEEKGFNVAQSADGRFFVTGGFQGFAEFGGTTFTAGGRYDAYVLALAPL